MPNSLLVTYSISYLIVVFMLGALRHLMFFKKLYESFGNFDALHKPRFEFGILSMISQWIAFWMLYYQVNMKSLQVNEFLLIVFLVLVSFIAFAELGKHKVHRVALFLWISILYCCIQTALVYIVFGQVPCRLGLPYCH